MKRLREDMSVRKQVEADDEVRKMKIFKRLR